MIKTLYRLIIVFLLAVVVAACNYPGYSNATHQPPTSGSSGAAADQGQVLVDPNCPAGLAPGRWTGSVESSTSASSMGLPVIQQNATISLQLDISCAGEISGSASREGGGEMRVPFMLDGACSETAAYQVSGMALSDNSARPALRLTFTAQHGALACNLNSNISSIPSGEQSINLAGTSFSVEMLPEAFSATQISGSQWPDTLYQDQFAGLQQVLDDYEITTQATASWTLTHQR